MTLERQAQALLDLVEADRAQQCDAILAEARARARAILAEAHRNARRQARQALGDQRQLAQDRLAAARARLQNRRRLREQRRSAALLALAWENLPLALLHRWQHPAQRQSWAMHAADAARAALPRSGWTIQHPAGWPDAEREALAAQLANELDAAPEFAADAFLRAGLRLRAGHNVIDATLEGLLADRTSIEAALLNRLAGDPR